MVYRTPLAPRRVRLAGLLALIVLLGFIAAPATAGMTTEARLEIAKRHYRTAELSKPDSPLREMSYRKAEELSALAVSEDPDSAEANFMLFAARGRRLLEDGGRPSLGSLWKFSSLQKYLTRTLELDPTHANALAAKGGLLLDLPAFLGGDIGAARELLERAIALNPTGPGTRLALARALHKQGLVEPAREQALLAAHYACVKRSRAQLDRAEQLLAELASDAL